MKSLPTSLHVVRLSLLIPLLAAIVSLVLISPTSTLSTPSQQYTITNLSSINTKNYEYSPSVTPDGLTLYFVSDRPGGQGGHDLWMAQKQDRRSSLFSAPKNLGTPINTDLNEGNASISADGKTVYFTGCERNDGLGDCDIYEAQLDNGVWKNVRNLTEVNSSSWDSQPSISSDGTTLYFVSTRLGVVGADGDIDIFVSKKGTDGKWSKPTNVGTTINTLAREDSPFISPEGDKLYFSSDGHGGFGGLDFFVASKGADGLWAKPENLGVEFNTSKDERFITMSATGDVIYFSSERTTPSNVGLLDIFMALSILPTDVPMVEKEIEATPRIYPNPATTSIWIEWSGIVPMQGEQMIRVFNSQGVEVAHATTTDDRYRLDVASLPNGAYFVRMGNRSRQFIVRR